MVAVTCLLDDRPHEFTEEDHELLRIAGQRIGMEFARKRLAEQKAKTLAALAASEEQNRLILDNAGDGIIILDEDCRIESCNPAALEMFGCMAKEVMQKQAEALFCNAHKTALEQGFIALANRLQLKFIAEGLENQEQSDFLLSQGCRDGQVYFKKKAVAGRRILAAIPASVRLLTRPLIFHHKV